jgi:hypothetical protein
MFESTVIGTVHDVDGSTVAVSINADVPTGLVFVGGDPHRVGQVGGFARISIGYASLVGVVSRVGAGAAPISASGEANLGTRWMSLQLVGEARQGRRFSRGVSQLPNVGDKVHLVTESDLASIYGGRSAEDGYVEIGVVASAESISARINLNQLVTRHSAVVGSTGSGKSTTVAALVQAISNHALFPSSRVMLFDIHGEYARALGAESNVFTINPESVPNSKPLFVPYWALSFDELIPLTFSALPDDAGRAFVRDEVVRLKREGLSKHPRPGLAPADVTADSPVPFSLKLLWYNLHVLLNATHSEPGNGQSRVTWVLLEDEDGNPVEKGDFDSVTPPVFAAQSQTAGAPKVYMSSSNLSIRRQVEVLASRLKDRRLDFVLNPGRWTPDVDGGVASDLDDLLEEWLGLPKSVSVVDLSGVPPFVISDLIGSATRLIYDAMFWARLMSEGTRERPLLMIFEEAHSYLGPTSSGGAKDSVQRIVREGRKYGIGAMVVSQRPSEMDSTILSQCGTIISMRLTNSQDRQHIVSAASDNMNGIMSLLPVLRTGEAIIVGESVPLPMRTLVRLPVLKPDSLDPVLVDSQEAGGWDKEREGSNYAEVVQAWRSQNPRPTKKETKLQRNPVTSSNVQSVGYDGATTVLEVEFANGSVYQYFDVPQVMYDGLLSAPSVGSFLNANIKGHFRYARA